MRVLFASTEGDGADIALRLQLEGHQVRLWIKDPEDRKDTFDGIVPKVQTWQGSLHWADLVICDHTGLPEVYAAAERAGKPVFGGSPWADRLEKDRPFGHKIMESVGLKGGEALSFKTIDQAMAHLREHKVRHVVKPCGPKVMSYHIILGRYPDGSDAIAMLERFEEQHVPFEQIEVEEFHVGIEAAVTGWFNAQDWLDINVNFEQKPLAAGDLGPLTGEMGETMLHVGPDNAFFKRTLDRVTPILRKERYRGIIDIGMIVKDDGSGEHPNEFTPRPGYPPIWIMAHLFPKGKLGEMFMACATGKPAPAQAAREWGIGVVVVTPGFPSRDEVEVRSAGTPIFKVNHKDPGPVHLVEATVKRGLLRTTDGHGYPAVVTAQGATIEAAQKDVYGFLGDADKFYIPNAWWRNDIGERVIAKMDVLKRLKVL